jgi:outer membrane protein assembly factor BamE (lipoprotein component of BamABCDE complex)
MKKILFSLMFGAALSACAPSTPHARIQANPEKYAALPSRQQDLVRQGIIDKGMSKEAVLLSWGPPSQRFEGYENSKRTERWDYVKSRAVSNAHAGIGYGYGGYGRYGRSSYFGLSAGPDFTYVPAYSGSVWFAKDRVISWERAR